MRTGIADREPFTDHAAQEDLAAGGAEQDYVAPMMLSSAT
ncbi:putative glutamate synthase [Mycobacterium kansasii]|uniref:Putative glutamate synthase n=1 Tax=Mycobacterium kansasii TaxID=1768 RepID=A0A1V3X9I3_MYCKA|nr:putative glutamate synthase [Mycobacterium kansasii]